MLPYSRELDVGFAAVQSAAKLSRRVIAATDKGVIEKDDLSPVTVADFAIQALLTATIHHAFPQDKLVGEESANDLRANPKLLDRVWSLLRELSDTFEEGTICKIPSSPEQMCEMIDWCGAGIPGGPDSGRVWVFDPIDGTKTFVQGELYAINIALLEGGKQSVSVVGCPNLPIDVDGPIQNNTIDSGGNGCIAYAVRGHGSYVRPMTGNTGEVNPRKLPLRSKNSTDIRCVCSVSMQTSGIPNIHEKIAERLNTPYPGCDLLGWVLRYVTLALGNANTTFWAYKSRQRYAKIWDHAGAMLLFEEIGGKITDIDGKDIDLTAGRKISANYGFVAALPELHDTVLRAVQDTLRQEGHTELLQ
jgi:3'(2'), 5'-bisphosphate nucleotidase